MTAPPRRRRSPLAVLLLGLIALYRSVSRFLPNRCRYLPTCSAYAVEAVERHGAIRGTGLAVRRLSRCHPWGGSGLDPVPVTVGRHRGAAVPTPDARGANVSSPPGPGPGRSGRPTPHELETACTP